jgi:uncharacterized membrane protein
MYRIRISALFALLVASTPFLACPDQLAQAQEPAVRAVLFYSPTCPHCEKVITEALPALFDVFGGPPRVWSMSSQDRGEPVVHFVSNGKLEMLLIDASWSAGQGLYRESIRKYQLPADREGVPQLVIGNSVLVGSDEIPSRLPLLVQRGLDGGGEPWPMIDGLQELVAVAERETGALALGDRPQDRAAEEGVAAEEQRVAVSGAGADDEPEQNELSDAGPAVVERREADSPTTTSSEAGRRQPRAEPPIAEDSAAASRHEGLPDAAAITELPPPQGMDLEADAVAHVSEALEGRDDASPSRLETIELKGSTLAQRFGRDPLGNGFSMAVLVAMIGSVIVVWSGVRRDRLSRLPSVGIPILCVLGFVVASYLSYVEVSGARAVCGPVGDCNAVQQSAYATLFGVLPVGVLGLIGYVAILTVWGVARNARGRVASLAKLLLLWITSAGTLFSIYLTFLEPFVIGATCAWCLASAIILTLLMWLSAEPGLRAWQELSGRRLAMDSGNAGSPPR